MQNEKCLKIRDTNLRLCAENHKGMNSKIHQKIQVRKGPAEPTEKNRRKYQRITQPLGRFTHLVFKSRE
jgi:ribosomal protein L44E